MRSLAGQIAHGAGWLLALAAVAVVALNPAVPSLPYAVFWIGVIALARGVSMLVGPIAVAVDLSLLFVCFLGMEIGGLILVPSVVAFAAADALRPEQAAARPARP